MGMTGMALGTNLVGSYLSNKTAKKKAKKDQEAARRQQQQMQGYAGPQNMQNLYGNYAGFYQDQYAPQLQRINDVLASRESITNQQQGADLGKRGMSGSGIDYALRGQQAANRSYGMSDAMRGFSTDVAQGARQSAFGTGQNQMQGLAQAPITTTRPTPSNLESLLAGFQGGMGQATQYAGLTGGAKNLGQLFGARGGPGSGGAMGPDSPYYFGRNVGRG